MFSKQLIHRVGVFNGFSACRLLCSKRSKASRFSIQNNRPIKQFNDIPTPRRLPLIGTKIDFLLSGMGKRFHEYIDNRHTQLGQIFREPTGATDVIFLKSPDMMREMFLYEGKYPKHPLPDAWTLYNEIHECKRGLFFMDDEEWLENRKLMNPMLLRNDFQLIQFAIENVTEDLIKEWNKNICNERSGYATVTGLLESLYSWAIKVLIVTMLGDTSNHTKIVELLPEFSTSVQKVFENTAPLMTVSPKMARKYNFRIWTKFETSVTKTLEIADLIVNIGLKLNGNGLVKDMQNIGMSTEMIKRIFVDLIIAAGDTTAYTTQWALFLLSSNPSEQSKIRDQLSSSSFETPLIRGTVRESLRLFPVATFIGRVLQKDGIIGNFNIPKHTPVIASMYSIGRDEMSFPSPNTFQPTRWVRDGSGNLQSVERPTATMAYAMGVRSCIGRKLANSMMHTVLSKILEKFELKLMNKNTISVVMRLIVVPNEPILMGIKRL